MPKYIRKTARKPRPFLEALKDKRYRDINFRQILNTTNKDFYKTALI